MLRVKKYQCELEETQTFKELMMQDKTEKAETERTVMII